METGFTLDNDEQILQRINRHWIALMPALSSAFMIVVVVIAISYLMARYKADIPPALPAGLIGLVMVIFVALAALMVIAGVWVYRRNYVLLTTKHLIRVEQQGLFNRSVSQLSLSRVQDVNSATPGFLPTILRYGTVTVQTAGEEDNFIFTFVPEPAKLADECLAAHDKYASAADGTNL